MRYAILSLGMAMITGTILTALLLGTTGGTMLIGSMLVAAVAAVMTLIWVVPTASICLAIVNDTSAGNDAVEEWPDAVWIDSVLDILFLFNAFALAAGAGMAVSRLLSYFGNNDAIAPWCAGATLFLVFPIALLSMLESASPMMPLSAALLRSLGQSFGAWVIFYLETGLLCGLFGLMLLGGYTILDLQGSANWGTALTFFALVVPLPFLSIYGMMVYFRILGRLVFVCGENSEHDEIDEDEEEL